MATDPTEGIRTLPAIVGTTTGAILSLEAEIVETSYGSALNRDFLWKKLRTTIHAEDFPNGQAVIIGFARGDMTAAEIAATLKQITRDPDEFGEWGFFTQANGIYWETLRFMSAQDSAGEGAGPNFYQETISMGGGKGLPLEGGIGLSLFVFNAHPSVSIGNAGSTIVGLYQLVGVFMKGQ